MQYKYTIIFMRLYFRSLYLFKNILLIQVNYVAAEFY